MSELAKPSRNMWAPINISPRGDWIFHTCVRFTRRDAKEAYLAGYDEKHHKRLLKNVRFARVTVMEQPGEGRG